MGPGGKRRPGLKKSVGVSYGVVSPGLVFNQLGLCMERGEVAQADYFLPGGPTVPLLNGCTLMVIFTLAAQPIGITMLGARAMLELILEFREKFQPAGYLAGWFFPPAEPKKRGMVSAQQEGASIQVRPEVLGCLDDGQQFASGHTVVLLCVVQGFTEISDNSLLALLNLGEDGSYAYCTGVGVKDVWQLRVRVPEHWCLCETFLQGFERELVS